MKLIEVIKAFSIPIAILIIHILVLTPLKVYNTYPWMDIPMHFIGGIAISLSFSTILLKLSNEKKLKTTKNIFNLFIISLVALTAVIWEFYEFSLDHLMSTQNQGGLTDTLKDIFLGLLGGYAGILLKNGTTNKHNIKKLALEKIPLKSTFPLSQMTSTF